VLRPSQGASKLQRWAEMFLIHEQLVLLNFLSP
jgi:hypothetical protein